MLRRTRGRIFKIDNSTVISRNRKGMFYLSLFNFSALFQQIFRSIPKNSNNDQNPLSGCDTHLPKNEPWNKADSLKRSRANTEQFLLACLVLCSIMLHIANQANPICGPLCSPTAYYAQSFLYSFKLLKTIIDNLSHDNVIL